MKEENTLQEKTPYKEITLESKEKYVDMVKELRATIKSEKYSKCPCPKVKCEWHGKCHECVLLHRVAQDHVPCCLQLMLRNKIKELAKVAEMLTEPKPLTPGEYWDYVNEVCPPSVDK